MPYARIVAKHEIPNMVIRAFLHQQFGHALFVMDDGNVLQCTWPQGVEIIPLSQASDFRHVDFTFDGIDNAIDYGKTLLGMKYDLKDILGIALESDIHDPSRMICSRFIVECASIGAKNNLLNPAVPFFHVAPGDIIFSPRITILDVWPRDLQL